jgi:tyrosinase
LTPRARAESVVAMTRLTAVANPASRLVHPIPATRNVTIRKSVYDLAPDEVADLRRAFAGIAAITDNRGFQHIAGQHGVPGYFCPHGNPDFLIWHRPYLLMLEQALQTIVPGLGLPYWDWSSPRALAEGIPAIFAEATYVDAAGATVPNPLFAQPISYDNPDHEITVRAANPVSALARVAAQVAPAKRETTYERFRPAVESPHNGLHGWVGGTMSDPSYAAFDPIFWIHHGFIEKLFCEWQDRNPIAIGPSIAGHSLPPFDKKAEEWWDYKKLGYKYLADGEKRQVSPMAALLADEPPTAPWTQIATFDLAQVPADFTRARLLFDGTRHPIASYEVLVFFASGPLAIADAHPAGAQLAATYFTFGHGACTGDAGHCDPPVLPEDATHFAMVRPRHHLTPFRIDLDVTAAVKLARATTPMIDVHVIGVTPDGALVPRPPLQFDMVTLDAV